MIRAVFLDIDDTLFSFDGHVRQVLQEGLPLFGISEYREGMEKIFHKVNNGLWHMLERGEITYPELYGQRFDRVFEAFGVKGDGQAFESYFKKKLCSSAIFMKGAREMTQYLARKYILCAASNGPYDQQENRLRVGGILPFFDYLFISEDIGASKPDPLFFKRAFERLNADGKNIRPDECVMIGDSLTSDMAGAIGFGMHTIFYDIHATGDTRGKKVDHIITDPARVCDIL